MRILTQLASMLGLIAACGGVAACREGPHAGEAPPTPSAVGAVLDVIVRGGTLYDGRGGPPIRGDVGIAGDRIVVVGDLASRRARSVIDATGLAVTPGFVDMLSHSEESLLIDGRAQSAVRQGVTFEVFGESSMGPVNDKMKRDWSAMQSNLRYEMDWSTLGGYLARLEKQGTATNVASFVGAGVVREHVIGMTARNPTADELRRMEALVADAMGEGALGVTTSLIYPPAVYSTTDELVALARVAASHGGTFAAHMRSEGARIEDALAEMIDIGKRAAIPVEIYHLKLAGRRNWAKLDDIVRRVDAARAAGVRLTADMYLYTAAATGLDASMPPWVQEDGYVAWARRLRDPATRARVAKEMASADPGWENFFSLAGPEGIRLIGFRNPELRPLLGKTLGAVARARGKTPEETAMDLVIEDGTRVECAYDLMTEDNVKRQVALPWVTFGSDASAQAPVPPFTDNSAHPRAYGNFARLLGKYVRDERVISFAEAVRRLTSLPAETLGVEGRGRLAAGGYADVVVLDPAAIADTATFEAPHSYARGVRHVVINGVAVLRDGEHTGATPGRVVRHRVKRASP